jgi:hypothetical protein
MFAGFFSRPKPESMNATGGATPAIICAFANAGVIPVLFSTLVSSLFVRGSCPLHASVEHGHLHVCRLLLESNAEVNVRDRKCDTRCYLRICKCGRDSGFVFSDFTLFFVQAKDTSARVCYFQKQRLR